MSFLSKLVHQLSPTHLAAQVLAPITSQVQPPRAAPVGFSTADQFQGPSVTGPRAPQRLSPNDLGVVPQNQNTTGTTNACGTTALASLMGYFGVSTNHAQIDQAIRPFNFGTGSEAIAAYANAHGFRAQVKDGASLDDVAKLVDQGAPPMVLIDPDSSSNTNTHYVTVTGYTRDASGKVNSLVISDTAGAVGGQAGRRYTMSAADFDKKWSNIKLAGINTGQSRELIGIVPAKGSISGADGVSRPASSVKLPTSSLKDELRAAPMHELETLANQVGGVVQKVRDFFRRLF